MAKVIVGNLTAVFAARSEQGRIRRLYCDVLGGKVRVNSDEVDRFQLEHVHFCFVYQSTALAESDFLKAIYLELKTDNTEEMKTDNSGLRRQEARCARSASLFSGSGWAGVQARGYR